MSVPMDECKVFLGISQSTGAEGFLTAEPFAFLATSVGSENFLLSPFVAAAPFIGLLAVPLLMDLLEGGLPCEPESARAEDLDEDFGLETKGILGEVGRRERGYEGREESWLPVRPSVKASLAGRLMNEIA